MWGFFELRILEIFTRAFFIKNHFLNFTLSVVTLSKIKTESQKRCKRPKKDSSHKEIQDRYYKRGKMKNEKYQKSLTRTIKFFTFFVCGKECILLENNSLGKCSLYYYISSKFF